MYSEILIIEETSLSGFFGSGARQTSEVESTRGDGVVLDPAGELDVVGEPELGGQLRISSSTSPSPMNTACQSLRAALQRRERPDRVVDAVLRAHHADVAEQVGLAALQRRIRLDRREARQVGAGADHEHVLGAAPPAGRARPVGRTR